MSVARQQRSGASHIGPTKVGESVMHALIEPDEVNAYAVRLI